MQRVTRKVTYNTMDKAHPPAAIVASGETVEIETELNGGSWLQSPEDRWDPSKSKGPNLCTVVAVEGAQPGDTLEVEILNIEPEGVGYTGFAGWRTKLSQQIWPNDWDVVTRTVTIDEDGVNWSNRLQLPIKPMIGTMGTAPAGEGLTNAYAYHTGGNMDVQEICPGTTLYLPVCVEGALLHVGDAHAIMGDGEIPHGGGIECRSTVTLRLTVKKGYQAHEWLRAENDEYIMTIANEDKMKDSFCGAARELIAWMCDDYGFEPQEAYLLLGQVMEARCTMLHGDDGPFSPYICKIAKKYLHPEG
ncbi:acetamidase/formamidase family protein [Collinsella provencensis]|uniref:acetamidase/formamidase family protein n=1 Tax=Collinsella provencensis TaxID=1937461 RepID=UPI000C825F91|nr:acetamidase/formamidase family protein [Collinsella provencensis]